jgi:hypothetical protein
VRNPALEEGRSVGPDPVPWASQWRRVESWKEGPSSNHLVATFKNVRSVSIDTQAACVKAGPLRYTVESDGPVTVRFSDGRVLSLAKGTSSGTLARR